MSFILNGRRLEKLIYQQIEHIMLNLLMLCNYPLTKSEIYGGTSSASYNLIQCLKKYTSINITTFSFVKNLDKYEDMYDKENGIRIIRYPYKLRYTGIIGNYPERLIFKKFLRSVNPDIVHAQGTDLYATLATTSNKPNVFTIHGVRLKEIELERENVGFLRYWVRKRLVLNNYRRAKNIVAINQYTKNHVAHLHNAKVWVIRNPIDEEYFEIYKEEKPEPGKILLVGGLRQRKDILTALEIVIKLMKENIKIHLDIVGRAEQDYEKIVRSYIHSHKLGDSVTIHGLVSDKKLKELYRTADIFLLTSLEESSPISIVQAMAAGKPVVATNVGGISEIVRNNKNANLHKVKDVIGMANSVKELITNRNKRETYSKIGHKIALEEWSPKSVALATYSMYEEILANRKK